MQGGSLLPQACCSPGNLISFLSFCVSQSQVVCKLPSPNGCVTWARLINTQAVKYGGSSRFVIKEAILLWRGTGKDFILRNSLQPPTHCKVSWDQRLLQLARLHSFLINVPISPTSRGAAPPGCSLGGSRIGFEMPLDLEQPRGKPFISILSLLSPARLQGKARPREERGRPHLCHCLPRSWN